MPTVTYVVLCAGLATRMGELCMAVSKPMLPVSDRPFLLWLVENLTSLTTNVLIVAGSQHKDIAATLSVPDWSARGVQVFHDCFPPSGTAGAIRIAAEQATTDHLFVLNGDTILDGLPTSEAIRHHCAEGAAVTQLLAKQTNQNENSISVQGGYVMHSKENGSSTPAHLDGKCETYASTGAYVITRLQYLRDHSPNMQSFERDLIPLLIERRQISAFPTTAIVNDFGTPERYAACSRAVSRLRKMLLP